MNYVDKTTIQLAEETTRTALFDEAALSQILDATYDTSTMPVNSPFTPIFEEVQIGLAVPRYVTVEGTWNPVGSVQRHEARFYVTGFSGGEPIRVAAFWRGRIVARTTPETGEIVAVSATRPDLSTIDADIVAALGELPTDPVVLEQERRVRLIGRLGDLFVQPEAATEALIDGWLARVGLTSVGDLLGPNGRAVFPEAVQVTFSPPGTEPPSPVALPLAAAILVRDLDFSVADLLAESKLLREQMLALGLGAPRDRTLPRRQELTVIWIVPASVFDDVDWPGGNGVGLSTTERRSARRRAAGQWLAREGIGLVATSS